MDTPTTSRLPIPLSRIGSQVKRRQSQSYKSKEFAKISNFWILKQTLHATHLLNPPKLLDKMCKYEMDLTSIVEDTKRTRFCPQTDRRTDGQGETSIPPFNFVSKQGGYNKLLNKYSNPQWLEMLWHICDQEISTDPSKGLIIWCLINTKSM